MKEKGEKRVPRTRMESIRGGKCMPLVPHACFSAWGGQTREFPRGWIKAAAPPPPPLVQPSGPSVCTPLPMYPYTRNSIVSNVIGISFYLPSRNKHFVQILPEFIVTLVFFFFTSRGSDNLVITYDQYTIHVWIRIIFKRS